MVSKRLASGSENRPPVQLSAKGLLSQLTNNQLHNNPRRRRNRTSAAPYNVKTAIEHAKRKSDKGKSTVRFNATFIPPADDVAKKSAAPQVIPLHFPKELARPPQKEVSIENIRAIEPELPADMKMDFLRDQLEDVGPHLVYSLTAVSASPPKDKLPKELAIVVNDMQSALPTHMLAIFGKPTPEPKNQKTQNPRKVTLFPVHSLILAAHCANLPMFPPTIPTPEFTQAPREATIPVWSLCLPSPITYPHLSTYLYTKRVDVLMKSLFPAAPPASLERDRSQVPAFAQHLAETFTVQVLVKHVLSVHGLWQNVCALGVFDEDLWSAMDTMWEVLLTAMAIGTGNPDAMREDTGLEPTMASSSS